jgi:hypothetical protein
MTPGQASESSLRYLPAFHCEINTRPDTPSTRRACVSTMAAISRRLTSFAPDVTSFLVLTGIFGSLTSLVRKDDAVSSVCQFNSRPRFVVSMVPMVIVA